jgi:hypothetical protein
MPAEPPRVLSPVFIAAAAVLAAAAAGLQPLLSLLIETYTKEPVAVRKRLDALDTSALRSWRLIAEDPTFRIEVDPDEVGTDDVIQMVFQPAGSPGRRPAEDTLLFVTYYNDPRDTIPHTPEVCYRQSGAIVHDIQTITIPVDGPGPEPVEVEARLLDLQPEGWHGALAYVLVCNARVYHDRKWARLAIGWPGDRRVYFSKVEAVSRCEGDDCAGAIERVRTMLAEALPVLMRDHFPGRGDVER